MARQGSFRKASEAPYVSAPSIDCQILRVEQELAVSLFRHHPTGLCLTAVRELFLHAANNWKKNFTWIYEQLGDLRGLRRGHMRIAAVDAINRYLPSTALRKVHKHYPNTSFTLTIISNIHIQRALTPGEADLGTMFNPQTSHKLQVRAFAEMNMGTVVLTDHLLAGRSVVRFSQYIDYPFILPSAPSMTSEPVEALVNTSGSEVKEVAVPNNIHMIHTLIKEQVDIGILCRLGILDETESGQLMFVPLTDSQFKPFMLTLCVSPVRQLPLTASMMLNQLEMLFSQLWANGQTLKSFIDMP